MVCVVVCTDETPPRFASVEDAAALVVQEIGPVNVPPDKGKKDKLGVPVIWLYGKDNAERVVSVELLVAVTLVAVPVVLLVNAALEASTIWPLLFVPMMVLLAGTDAPLILTTVGLG